MNQQEFDAIADEFGVEHPFEVGRKYGLSRDEQLELMRVHNEGIFADWAFDFAKRAGRPISEVRAEVLRQRQLTAQHCNEVYRREIGIKESKEDTMAKKNDVQTITNENANEQEGTTMTENITATANTESKEDTIMTIKGIPTNTRKNGNVYYDRNTDIKRHHAIRDEFNVGRIKGIEVTTCIPNESWENFTDDPKEVELLGKVCKKLGWTNGVCTVAKAMKYHGAPNPEYTGHGWLVKYLPRTPKSGKNAGVTTVTETVVYPMEAFVWDTESGLPEFDVEKKALADARKAKSEANRAVKQLREANKAAGIKTPRRKTSRKPAAKKVETIANEPVPMAAPAGLIHIKLANGVEFDARDAKEAAELKALFE